MPIIERVKSAWNAFRSNEQAPVNEYVTYAAYGPAYAPSRPRRTFSANDKSIVTSVYNRIAIDVAGIQIRHTKLDDQGRYLDDVDSTLSSCLNLEPNLDQGPRSFRQDIVMTLFDKGAAAIVPVDTAINPQTNEVFDIFTLRVGEIIQFLPKHVRINLYNEEKGQREQITLEKRFVAIVENPLFSVMNEPNSTLQRLIRKIGMLDAVDEQTSSGKLDLIVQLPYTLKSETQRQRAEQRREDIEFQLKGSQYGIAYTDGTERITQLNRPAENNLLKQVEYLTAMLYGQLGITEAVMNGTADEATMVNYYNRTVDPIAEAIVEAMQRAFVGPVGVKKKEKIDYFKNPFKLIPVSQFAEVADKFARNEILSSNEIRGYLGIPPSKDPKADQLVNSNLKAGDTRMPVQDTTVSDTQASA